MWDLQVVSPDFALKRKMLICPVANRMHVPGDSHSKGKWQFPLPAEKSLCHFWDVQVQRKKKKKNCDLSSRHKENLKRHPCWHLHPPPWAIKHQSLKCLGKAFPTLPRLLPFCKKGQREPNANDARVDKWIGLLRFDMHAGSNEILIHPPWLKSWISYATLFLNLNQTLRSSF